MRIARVCPLLLALLAEVAAAGEPATGQWTAFGPPPMVGAVAVDPANPLTVYAGPDPWWRHQSVDGGAQRNLLSVSFPYVSTPAIDPSSPNTLYAAGASAAFGQLSKTTDGGTTWAPHLLDAPLTSAR